MIIAEKLKDIKKMAACISLAIFFISLDRFLKIIALNNFNGETFTLIRGWLNFGLAGNYFIAFSLPIRGNFLLILISLIILILFGAFFYSLRRGRLGQAIFLLIIILGAMSNLVDRLKYGYVVDYFDLKYFTVFNLADAMIVAGVLGMAQFYLKTNRRKPS